MNNLNSVKQVRIATQRVLLHALGAVHMERQSLFTAWQCGLSGGKGEEIQTGCLGGYTLP